MWSHAMIQVSTKYKHYWYELEQMTAKIMKTMLLKLYAIVLFLVACTKSKSLREGDDEFYGIHCTLIEDGFYVMKNAPSVKFQRINYYYEVIYNENRNIQKLVDGLDRYISQKVLDSSSLFKGCEQSSSNSSDIYLSTSIDYRAISARPHDTISNRLCPTIDIPKKKSCHVTIGAVSIFYKGDAERIKSKTTEIKQYIKNSLMGPNGEIAKAYKSISGLNYLTKNKFHSLSTREVTDKDDTPNSTGSPPEEGDDRKESDQFAISGIRTEGGDSFFDDLKTILFRFTCVFIIVVLLSAIIIMKLNRRRKGKRGPRYCAKCFRTSVV